MLESLRATGHHVEQWWEWCWRLAEQEHDKYLVAPMMQREQIRVQQRVPAEWAQIATWIYPKFVGSLPQQLKKQVTEMSVHGRVRYEAQDLMFLLLKQASPGAQEEKAEVNRRLNNPQPCSKAQSALNEILRWKNAHRRCLRLGMQPPDVTLLYTAYTSISSGVLAQADEGLRHRWINLQNQWDLPRVITWPAFRAVGQFIEGELGHLALHGSGSGNPGLPLTDAQKKQEAQKKKGAG